MTILTHKYGENSFLTKAYIKRFFEEAVNSQQKQNGALKKEKNEI